MINQVEFQPCLYQKGLLEFCNKNKIVMESYSPLTIGLKLNEPELLSIAKRYNRSAAQIMIRWVLQHGVVVLPKSADPERIGENARIFDFEITPADMQRLDNLNQDWHCTWDPTDEL
jgi:methylglyoxal/glyoxal reductase